MTPEDRELLEAAAKAAGMQRLSVHWNPLEDDGDALRLAVKLNIQMTPGDEGDPYTVVQWWTGPDLIEQDFERVLVEDGNRTAALRRAIVRAAAAIGKDMT